MDPAAVQREPASFRDPTGYVFRRDGRLFRAITPKGRADFEHFLASGLAAKLMDLGLIVPFRETENASEIELRELEFITYPYEWSFGQLRDAALLTLELAAEALEHDMILQDATAFNVAFRDGKPVFLDHGSFCIHRPGQPWGAYRQFVMHFLAPLLLMKHVDLRCLDLFRAHVEGFPLDFASRLLPAKTWFMIDPLIHVHLHALMEKKYSSAKTETRTFSAAKKNVRTLLKELADHISSLTPPGQKTDWGGYYLDNNYSGENLKFKKARIEKVCGELAPSTTVDLGANTGLFSEIAARYSGQVVAADIDSAAVEALYLLAKTKCPNVLPVLLDLNNPSPAVGVFNRERRDFFSRCRGELVLGLALAHHLRISGNWPLTHIVDLFADMTSRAAVVEFVPKQDSQVRRLLRSREDIFDDWQLGNVVVAFKRRFRVCKTIPIPDSERILLELYL